MMIAMADIQIKNLPDALFQRLRHYARKHHRAINDIAVEALEREMARRELHDKLSQQPAADLGDAAASLLDQDL